MISLFAKHALAYVSIDLQTTIINKGITIFSGLLEEALVFARTKGYKLELVFDYGAGYLFMKSMPEAMEKKNRAHWELYQEKDLFSNAELIENFQYPWCTVWLTLSHIKPLIIKFRKQIKKIRWLGYEFYQSVKHLAKACQLFIIEEEKRTIILGVVNQALLVCRVLDNKNNLKHEIEETAVYLAKFDDKKCDVIIFANEYNRHNKIELADWFKVQTDVSLPVFTAVTLCESTLIKIHKIDLIQYITTGILTMGILIYSMIAWNVKMFDVEHQHLLQEQETLNTKLSEYPDFAHIYKLEEYTTRYNWEKDIASKVVVFVKNHGAVLKYFKWKDKQIDIQFAIREPANYQEFLQLGNMLKHAIKKHFPNATVDLSTDISVQTKSYQIYNFKVSL